MEAPTIITTAQIGHNLAPPEAVIGLRVDELIGAADKWIGAVPKISDEDTAKAARDFIAQLAAQEKIVEEERNRQRKPHLEAADAVQMIFKPMGLRLDLAKKKLLGILDTWNKAEKARIQAEADAAVAKARKAEADAAEAAMAAKAQDASIDDIVFAQTAQDTFIAAAQTAKTAAAAKPKLSGNVAGRALAERTTWTAEIQEWSKVAAHFIGNTDLRAELQRLANAVARESKADFAIPGATVKKDTHL